MEVTIFISEFSNFYSVYVLVVRDNLSVKLFKYFVLFALKSIIFEILAIEILRNGAKNRQIVFRRLINVHLL